VITRTRVTALAIAAAAAVVIVLLIIAIGGGNSDGPAAFLSKDPDSAVFVSWTRVGDDVSGSLSAAEVAQPQPGLFQTVTPGQVEPQTASFTGTVRNGSVRLLIGSGTATNRINGQLDGDTLELTIPQDSGVQRRRLTPASEDDYTNAVRDIRDHEQQRKDGAQATEAREERAARPAITQAAIAFQQALAPASSDNPCRYMTAKLKKDVVSFGDSQARSGRASAGRSCAKIARDSQANRTLPLYDGAQGVARIDFSEQVMAVLPSPPGAIVTWRDESARATATSRTPFTQENGRWLVYDCCQ
jgi:hypothetical protein